MAPTIRKTPLKRTRRGYVRQIGRATPNGSVKKFYLGNNMAIAAQRRQWIEAVYVENCRVFQHNLWTDTFLDIARQIERQGSAVLHVEPTPGMPDTRDFSFVQRLRDVGVPLSILGEPAKAAVTLAANVTPQGKPAITKLHEAIKTYKEDRVSNYSGGYQGGQRLARQIDKFLELEDCWLHELSFATIKCFVDRCRKRPMTEHGKRCSKTYAENQISEFYKFLDFLEATKSDEFTCPKLASIDRSVIRLPSDTKGNAIRNVSWAPDELREVFKTAEPLARLIIGLGLNACSGAAELGRIRVDDFHLGCKHPHSETIRYDGVHDWLITTRRKTYTHSEAVLWPWVSRLVREQIAICKENGWPYLFTEDGEPLYRDDEIYDELGLPRPYTTKPESRFVKRYGKAVSLAFRQGRLSTKRSLGKLRKTFSNYLTIEAHGDLASLALSHLTDEDQLLRHYANKPYARLFKETLAAEHEWRLDSTI